MTDGDENPKPVAIVTGATGGMGQRIVARLATTHEVIVVGRSRSRLEQLRADFGVRISECDLTSPPALRAVVANIDRLDVLIHAAAIATPLRVDEASVADWDTQLSTNVIAPAELTRLCLPMLRESSGTIVFINSGAGSRPVPGSAVYTASKHALKGLADVLRIDEAESGIRVVTVSPGQTDTEMLRATMEKSGQPYQPEKYIHPDSVAQVVQFAVSAPPDVHLTDFAVRPRRELR